MELAEGEYGSLLNVVTGTAIGTIMGGIGGAIAENGQPLIGDLVAGLVPGAVEVFADFPRKMYKAVFCGER